MPSIEIYTLSLHDALPIYFALAAQVFVHFDGRDNFVGVGKIGLVPVIKDRSEEHTSELQSLRHLVCRLSRSTLFPYTTLFRSTLPLLPRYSSTLMDGIISSV